MKSRKLLSLMLTAALALSSLPMALMTSVGAEDTVLANTIPKAGFPNVGVIMMMLAKMELAEKTTIVTTEYVKNGSFDTTAVIHDEVKTSQTTADEGWWTRSSSKHTSTLTQMTEDGNSFLRVNNVSSSGVFYNTGVVLQPGTYDLSVDLRVYESENIQVRVVAVNPENINSFAFADGTNVDTETVLNNKGASIGKGLEIKSEWTTYTDKIVLEKETLLVVTIRRFTNSKWEKNFDIDNLSITKAE